MFYNTKKKNNKKLSNLLLKNYISFYFFSMIIFVSILFFLSYMSEHSVSFSNPNFSAKDLIKDDFRVINTEYIEKYNGWIEIVDENLNIVFTKGNRKYNRTSYTKDEFFQILTNTSYTSIDDIYYDTAYNSNKHFTLLVMIPYNSLDVVYFKKSQHPFSTFISISIIVYVFALALSLIIFSKRTSKHFLIPLRTLLDGVKKLTRGDYSTRINVKFKNEFGEITEAFNLMAKKIEEERTLKEKSEENRRMLILDISHDLKNPLSAIVGYSDLLIKRKDLPYEDRVKYLDIIFKNSLRADTLIKDLFEFSKYDSKGLNLNLKNIDICEFLRELIALYIEEMEVKKINYNIDIPEEPIFVNMDEKGMDRALSNLIINSIKYNPSNTTLNIKLEKSIHSVEIIIQDDGIGIPSELSSTIFDPFKRVDSSRNSKTGGTGLGLAITKTIIEKHNGSISLETALNKGCKFLISLPL